MPRPNLKVYLDHHIKRDNLLYKPQGKPVGSTQEQPTHLTIRDLWDVRNPRSKARLLRKPDFQRATWAWTPEDCVELLESVLHERVVPSVIMWLSPDGSQYVLDGGHRISVLLAWIKDDWGDKLASDKYTDRIFERDSKAAARSVRDLLRRRDIGFFDDYMEAEAQYGQLEERLGRPPQFGEIDPASLKQAEMARKWEGVNIGFPIQWVKGDYVTAEQSFLKINKTGRQLSEWETKLVENRSSSFARTVMSISQVNDAEHCWPIRDPEVTANAELQGKVSRILKGVHDLHQLLFTPEYVTPVNRPEQPLLATPWTQPELMPFYLAEVLTITEGKKGRKPETDYLIKLDRRAPTSLIINNGLKLVQNALDVLWNIHGPSPRSLGLMPLVYFYNPQGVYVRSLLYGMLYWLNHGPEERFVLNRKRLFSAYREAFEEVLLASKNSIIYRITRRLGSGSEVTYATARYYQGLLELLIRHGGEINSQAFKDEHEILIETLGKARADGAEELEPESASRTYRGRMRSGVNVRDFLERFNRCEICGGRYLAGLYTQVDHIQQHSQGGKTTLSNGRNTHPFCNVERETVEAVRGGEMHIELPPFEDPKKLPKEQQLNLYSLWEEHGEIELLEALDEDDGEELEAVDEQ